jgi:prepilin signal peptidase PulO-like enzyme (type II secretory pathway)
VTAFFLFILGLFFGSFLNVLADHLPQKKSIFGRSHCEYCNKVLKWYDLIPVVSFVLLQGKCRYCHEQLSLKYPISEIVTGVLFLMTYLSIFNYKFSILNQITINQLLNLLYSLIVISSLIIIFFADLKHRIIPDKILFPTTFLVVAFLFLFQINQLPSHLIAGVICFLFFLGIYVVTRGKGMGFGDVKFAVLIGLFLGIPLSFAALYLAFLTGAGVSIILILWKKAALKSTISFGPFLVIGTILTFFLQEPFVKLFHHFLG